MADRRRDRLRQISEALDGEGTLPDDLDAEEASFLGAAQRIRSRLRVEGAEAPPDVTDAVLDRVRRTVRRRQPTALVAAAVFVVAALSAALAVRLAAPEGPAPALADVGQRIVGAQDAVATLDASLSLVERGAHPDVPERRYRGTLRYRAPERLWLHLEDRTQLPPGWPTNDVDVVVVDGTAWSTGHRGCPVDLQPACLDGGTTRTVEGLAPFAPDWLAPLELIVPADGFLVAAATTAREAGGELVVETTVARVHRVVEGIGAAGALRSVHPSDAVRLALDPRTLTLRRMSVSASDGPGRATWAAGAGYRDRPGDVLLDLVIDAGALPAVPFPAAPARSNVDAGFRDRSEVEGPVPGWLPTGFTEHRRGVQRDGGPSTTVRSWSNGRAWVRLDATEGWRANALFGSLGPLVRAVPVGGGTGYTDAGGVVLALHGADVDVALTGSVPLDVLVAIGASLPVAGQELPPEWPQSRILAGVPDGALAPRGPLTARYDGADLLVAVPGPGDTGAVLTQRLGRLLDPPPKGDVVEVEVRGIAGRYAPRLGTLSWAEDGWVRELRSSALDVDQLRAIADALIEHR